METPKTLQEAIAYFADPDWAREFVVALRWPNGVACPRYGCGSASVQWIATRKIWRCKECKKQFTAKVGTVFEDSPISFDKWLPAFWLLSANKNGISSYELHRAVGVTQKTAWFMLHRIRLAMKTKTFEKLHGVVEADETFIGVKLRHRRRTHYHVPSGLKPTGPVGKKPILGIMERGGDVRGWVLPDVKKRTLLPKVIESIEKGSTVHTDSALHYRDLPHHSYAHMVVNHAIEYVSREGAHVNNMECFWAVLKRTLGGTYIAPRPKHLEAYLDEQIFRFNNREINDGPRFAKAVKAGEDCRITYKELTAKS